MLVAVEEKVVTRIWTMLSVLSAISSIPSFPAATTDRATPQRQSGLAATVTGNPTISWVILTYFFIQVVP